MIGYATLGTNNLARAQVFYDALLAEIGAKPGNGNMLALVLPDRAKVDALYKKALELGGSDEGPPGVRGEEGPEAFYAAYFRDPEGNKLCAYRVGPK